MYNLPRYNINKIKNSKKAFIASGMMDMWLFVMFVLVAIIFVVLVMITDHNIQEKIAAESGKIAAEQYFMNFLRTPIQMKDSNNKIIKGWIMTPLELTSQIGIYGTNSNEMRNLDIASNNFINTLEAANLPLNVCYVQMYITPYPIGDKQEISKQWDSPEIYCGDEDKYTVSLAMQAPTALGSKKNYQIIMEISYGTAQHKKIEIKPQTATPSAPKVQTNAKKTNAVSDEPDYMDPMYQIKA